MHKNVVSKDTTTFYVGNKTLKHHWNFSGILGCTYVRRGIAKIFLGIFMVFQLFFFFFLIKK